MSFAALSRSEMDYRTGQILDAIKQAGSENDTLVVRGG
jgi:arylsulfatase A-like enzyme